VSQVELDAWSPPDAEEACSFRYAHYRFVLERLKGEGYRTLTYSAARAAGVAAERAAILRHDIDYRPDRALRMARLEAAEGVAATYFVRLHAPGYNAFGFRELLIWRELLAAGHQIGLHTEVLDLQPLLQTSELDVLRREKTALEQMIGQPVTAVCPHGDFTGLSRGEKPYAILERLDPTSLGFTEHPATPAIRSFKYLADSLQNWREGCVCQWIGKADRLHVNAHADWWFHDHFHLG
jgi:hypothetical protein